MLDSLDCTSSLLSCLPLLTLCLHKVRIGVFDAVTQSPVPGLALSLEGSSSSSGSSAKNVAFFTFNPSRGPFHNLKLSLTFSPSFIAASTPPKLAFRLFVASPRTPSSAPSSTCSTPSRRLRQIIGEEIQDVAETWEGKNHLFLGVTSGPMEVKVEGKEVKVAGTKGTSPLLSHPLTSAELIPYLQYKLPSARSTSPLPPLLLPTQYPSPTLLPPHPSPLSSDQVSTTPPVNESGTAPSVFPPSSPSFLKHWMRLSPFLLSRYPLPTPTLKRCHRLSDLDFPRPPLPARKVDTE
jgi:hypothetical protein